VLAIARATGASLGRRGSRWSSSRERSARFMAETPLEEAAPA